MIRWRYITTEIWVNIGSGEGLFAWRHQAIMWTNIEFWVNIGSGKGLLPDGTTPFIIWTNIELSSEMFCGIHLSAISQEVLKNLLCNINS